MQAIALDQTIYFRAMMAGGTSFSKAEVRDSVTRPSRGHEADTSGSLSAAIEKFSVFNKVINQTGMCHANC